MERQTLSQTGTVVSGLLVAALVCLGLSACSSDKTATTSSSEPASPSPTSPSTSTGGSAPASSTPVTSSPASTRCHTSELSAALQPAQGGAGSIFTPLSLTNTGTRTCVVTGYPGVSLLDASGAILGVPATRDPGTVVSITLAPKAAAHTIVDTQNAIDPTQCGPMSTSVLIYPPDETDSITIAGALQICGGVLGVLPMAAGATG